MIKLHNKDTDFYTIAGEFVEYCSTVKYKPLEECLCLICTDIEKIDSMLNKITTLGLTYEFNLFDMSGGITYYTTGWIEES